MAASSDTILEPNSCNADNTVRLRAASEELGKSVLVRLFLLAVISVALFAPAYAAEPAYRPGIDYMLWQDNFDRYASVVAMTTDGTCGPGTAGYGVPSAQTTYGQRTNPNTVTYASMCDPDSHWALITGRNGSGKALHSTIYSDPPTPGNGTNGSFTRSSGAWTPGRWVGATARLYSSQALIGEFVVTNNTATTLYFNGDATGAINKLTFQQSVTWLSPWGLGPYGYYTWGPYPSQTIVVQFWFRTSPGGTPGTYGTKWMELWDNTNNRVQWGLWSNTDTRPLWTWSYSVLGPNRPSQPVGPWWDQLNDGQWHNVTILFKVNNWSTYQYTSGSGPTESYTGSSSRDGRQAMWVDGVKIQDYSQATVNVTPPGGLNPWCYQGDVDAIPAAKSQLLKFPDVFNGAPVDWTLDHDDIQVWALNETDTAPPTISNGQPAGTYAAGTVFASMSVTTDENATCRYSTTSNTAYAGMTNSFIDAGISHTAAINVRSATSYNYYVRCNDTSGNVDTSDYVIAFSVASDEPQPVGVTFIDIGNSTSTLNATLGINENFNRYTSIISMQVNQVCPSGTDGYGVPNSLTVYGPHSEAYSSSNSCIVRTVHSLVPGRGGSGQAARTHIILDASHTQSNSNDGFIMPSQTSPRFSYPANYTFVAQGWFNSNGVAISQLYQAKWWMMWYRGYDSRTEAGINTDFHVNPGIIGEIGHQPVGPYPWQLNDTNWHRFTFLWKPNTVYNYPSASSRDGRAAVWIDGIKIVDVSAATANVTPPGGTKVWCTMNEVDQIPPYQVVNIWPVGYINGADSAMDLDWDDLRVWAFGNSTQNMSNQTQDTIPPPAPGTPQVTLTNTGALNATYSVTWSASIDQPSGQPVPTYNWSAGMNSGPWTGTGTVNMNTLTLQVPYLANGSATTGYICVTAVDAAGNPSSNSCNSINVPSQPVQNASQNLGDLNGDGRVDFLDLLIVIGQFRRTGASITNTRADINNDGTVNLFDFVLLAKNWGKVYSVSSGEPIDPGSGYLYQDNFNGYASTTAMWNNNTGVLGTQNSSTPPGSDVSLITGHGGSGQALRFSVPPFSSEYLAGAGYYSANYGNHNIWASYTGALVFQWWFRISTTALDVQNSYKWLYLLDSLGQRINEMPALVDYRISPASANGTFEGGRWQFYVEGTGTLSYPMGYQPVGPYFAHNRSGQPASLNDYTWHRQTMLLRPQSSIGARDGRMAVWIDGIKIIDVSAATEDQTPPGGDLPWCYSSNPFYGSEATWPWPAGTGPRDIDNIPVDPVRAFIFPANYQPPNTQPFTEDFDDIKVWTVP